ncbi:hypothetical protein TIFTF001_007491 [Ficus carica]|uniref:Uncharacterized protein n=1 Tax=Ficus carica TaxID=3494 RepID=A0AA88DGH9_FICCA|nr:hypothetical protein TIFTF001_007491 [Ficus carica]
MPESVSSATQSINLQCTLVIRTILIKGRIQNPTSPRTPGFVGLLVACDMKKPTTNSDLVSIELINAFSKFLVTPCFMRVTTYSMKTASQRNPIGPSLDTPKLLFRHPEELSHSSPALRSHFWPLPCHLHELLCAEHDEF